MNGSFKIGKLFGIPIMIHFTFLLIIPLFAWIIGNEIGYTVMVVEAVFMIPIDSSIITEGFMPYILGAVVALGLFACVYAHELSHSLVARRFGIKINSITLLMIGGVAAMENQEPDPYVEIKMAAAGPLMSFVIGILCAVLVYSVDTFVSVLSIAGVLIYVLGYLSILNMLLFMFNLIPAFPMDGGRVLRAYLATRMPLHKATSVASSIGKGFAVLFAVFGIFILSPLLILIAFFIYIGAGQESMATRYNFLLKDVNVRDIMSFPVTKVEPSMPLTSVIDLMYATKHLGYPVVDNGRLIGMITFTDLNRVSSIDREAMQVRDVMSTVPITLPPHSPVIEALQLMSANDIGRIPILSGDELIGIITKSDIITVMELREM